MGETISRWLLHLPAGELADRLAVDLELENGLGRIESSSGPLEVRLVTEFPRFEALLDQTPAVDVAALIIRHAELHVLERLEHQLEVLRSRSPVQSALLLIRDEGSEEFKMNCFFCGQKLWVRDADNDKRGRCPSCRKAFTLPSQTVLVQRQFDLPGSFPVAIVRLGRPAGTVGLFASLSRDRRVKTGRFSRDAIHRSTVRIQFPEPED